MTNENVTKALNSMEKAMKTGKGQNNKKRDKVSLEVLMKKRENSAKLLARWRKQRASCERKVKKYRLFKRQFSAQLAQAAGR